MNPLLHLAQQAAHELKFLRQRNEILEAQMFVVNVFAKATSGIQGEGRPMSPDIVWQIDQECQRLRNLEEAQQCAESVAKASQQEVQD